VDSKGMVDIGKFLTRWVVTLDSEEYTNFLVKAVKHVYEAILSLDMDLEQTLMLFDADGDSTVTLQELRQVLGMFDLGLTTSQLDRLTGQIFVHCADGADTEQEGQMIYTKTMTNSDGGENKIKIGVQDFLKHLTVVYKQASTVMNDDNRWAFEALDKIGRLIMKTPQDCLGAQMQEAATKIQAIYRGKHVRKEAKENPSEVGTKRRSCHVSATASKNPTDFRSDVDNTSDLIQAATNKMVTLFQSMDTSGDGMLQIDEFVAGIQKLPGIEKIVLSNGTTMERDVLMNMAQVIDVSGNGTINYLEFLQAFAQEDTGKLDIADSLGEDIVTTLFRHRHAIRMGFHYLDDDGAGKIKANDFQAVLQGVNSALSRPEKTLTNTQISLLVGAMSSEANEKASDGEPLVNYEFFLKSFVILDKEQDRKVVKKFT